MLYPLEIETPDRMLNHDTGHIRYLLLFHDYLELVFKRGGHDRNCGNAFLFEIELVNYQP